MFTWIPVNKCHPLLSKTILLIPDYADDLVSLSLSTSFSPLYLFFSPFLSVFYSFFLLTEIIFFCHTIYPNHNSPPSTPPISPQSHLLQTNSTSIFSSEKSRHQETKLVLKWISMKHLSTNPGFIFSPMMATMNPLAFVLQKHHSFFLGIDYVSFTSLYSFPVFTHKWALLFHSSRDHKTKTAMIHVHILQQEDNKKTGVGSQSLMSRWDDDIITSFMSSFSFVPPNPPIINSSLLWLLFFIKFFYTTHTSHVTCILYVWGWQFGIRYSIGVIFPRETISSSLRMHYLLIVLCLVLRPHELSPLTLASLLLSSLFRSYLHSHVGKLQLV